MGAANRQYSHNLLADCWSSDLSEFCTALFSFFPYSILLSQDWGILLLNPDCCRKASMGQPLSCTAAKGILVGDCGAAHLWKLVFIGQRIRSMFMVDGIA